MGQQIGYPFTVRRHPARDLSICASRFTANTAGLVLLGIPLAVSCSDPRTAGDPTGLTGGSGAGEESSGGDAGGTSAGTGPMDTEGGASSGDDGTDDETPPETSGASDGSGGDGGIRLDVGAPGTSGASGAEGSDKDECQKLDFLFVIDNSGSMTHQQANLIRNFPAFITGIQSTFDDVDSLHVGITTTDNSCLVDACGPYSSGEAYMTEADDLATTFGCAANVGIGGSDNEVQVQRILDAVEEADAGPGQCNEGFLRPDSLLIVVLLTDEADGPSELRGPSTPGTPQEWFDRTVAARGGIETNIVMLSLVLWEGGPCQVLRPAVQSADDILEYTEQFTHGIVGGICEDFGPYFMEAIGVIENACAGFVPPG